MNPFKALARAIVFLSGLAALPSFAADTPNQVFARVGKIVTEDGIQEQKLVTIGGIPQWISVRGRHRGNPVLLFLHGGPGFTVSPVSYYYMRDWEEYFTVVQWDQRGAGKTYSASKPVRANMTIDRMVSDGLELTDYLRHTYGKDRIVLMAHSFGTLLGTRLAQRHPDRFHAYVGMGQFVDAPRSEAMGFAATLAAARAAGNQQAVSTLEALAPFPDPAHPERDLQNLGKERFWLATYGGYWWRSMGHNEEISRFSPDYTAEDMKQRDIAQGFSDEALWGVLGKIDLTGVTRLDCPVVIFQGRHDLGTSSALVADWFGKLRAPSKELVWFEDSAHMVHEEEPGRVLVSLVEKVLPLTRAKAR